MARSGHVGLVLASPGSRFRGVRGGGGCRRRVSGKLGLLGGCGARELLGTQQILRDLTGTAPVLFRPPFGRTNAQIRALAEELGTTEVLWTVDTRDYAGATVEQIVASAGSARAGDVVLMHDGYDTTVQALPQVVQRLRSRGLCPGRLVRSATETEAWPGQTFAATVESW